MSGIYSLPKAFWDVDNRGEPGRFVFLNDFQDISVKKLKSDSGIYISDRKKNNLKPIQLCNYHQKRKNSKEVILFYWVPKMLYKSPIYIITQQTRKILVYFSAKGKQNIVFGISEVRTDCKPDIPTFRLTTFPVKGVVVLQNIRSI